MREMWEEVEKSEKLQKISKREVGQRTFQSNLVKLSCRLRSLQGSCS